MLKLDTFGVQRVSMEEASVGRSLDQSINFHEPTAMTMKVVSLQNDISFCNTKMLLMSSV